MSATLVLLVYFNYSFTIPAIKNLANGAGPPFSGMAKGILNWRANKQASARDSKKRAPETLTCRGLEVFVKLLFSVFKRKLG